jgi:hypothetical protein
MPQSEDLFSYAEQRMNQRFLAGEREEAALIEQVAKTVIVDRLVPPHMMSFATDYETGLVDLRYGSIRDDGHNHYVTLHPHAFRQLCEKVSFPAAYANHLRAGGSDEHLGAEKQWKQELLAHNLNALYHQPAWEERSGAPQRFLHRIVGDELRGFLSRRFARHMASAPLLRAFVDACRHAGARPISATSSPVRLQLQCLLPHVFEAYPQECVCVGCALANSDFGAGRLTVKSTIWRVSNGTSAVIDEAFSKVHVGSIIDESDLELSDSTAQKEVIAQRGLITDVVTQLLQEKTVNRLLQMLRAAHDLQIPWSKLKGRLSAVLSKSDLTWMQEAADTGAGIVDLPSISYTPEGERIPNAYWAAAALSAIAAKTEDADRKLDLQQEAGKLLSTAA